MLVLFLAARGLLGRLGLFDAKTKLIQSLHKANTNIQYSLYSIQYTAHSIQHTGYSIQCTIYSTHHAVYSIQETVLSIKHTAYGTIR